MREDLKWLMRMPWKHRCIMLGLLASSIIICMCAFDSIALITKGILFAWVLLVGAYFDIKTRRIPDWIHVLIMFIALIEINQVDSLLGILIVPMPFFIMAYLKEGSMGGGDIKLISACGFLLGIKSAYIGAVIALILAIVCNINGRQEVNNISFPFAPYLTVGMLIAYYL